MKLRHFFAAITLFSTASIAAAAPTCGTDVVDNNFAYTRIYLKKYPDEIGPTQRYLRDGFGYSRMSVDGKLGPQTLQALCTVVTDHHAIFGTRFYGLGHGQEVIIWMEEWTAGKRDAAESGTVFEAAD